jgi:hypothetical protein
MDSTTNIDQKRARELFSTALAAAAIYCVYYFVLCKMPIVGIPTFRIDYFATTLGRADDSLARTFIHARPISELYIYVQALLAKYLFGGQASFIIYPVQHVAPLIYFLSISLVIDSLLREKLHPAMLLAAWLLFMTNPGIIGNAYKLETIVGTLSMVFGGLSLVFLTRWERRETKTSGILFLVFYVLSVFSKEDFILPPIFLLGWYLVKEGSWRTQFTKHKWLLIATLATLIVFFVFNKMLLPTRSYMDPAAAVNSPYFMTLNPISLIKVILYYTMGVGLHIKILTAFYLVTSVAAIFLKAKIRETLLVGLIISGLMAPYLIMPNHLFSYYGINWWAWQSILPFALLQIFFPNRCALLSAAASACILVPGVGGIVRHRSIDWNQSNYLRSKFAISQNIRKTLIKYRDDLNKRRMVGVIGLGPTQIDQSPWQANGETAFYLKVDLGITSQWTVFVTSSSSDYAVNADPKKNIGFLDDTPDVYVENITDLNKHKGLPLLVFAPDGVGTLVNNTDHAPADPVTLSIAPFLPPASKKDVRRKIIAADEYQYLRGFNQSEGDNGRWLSGNNVILLAPEAGDQFELVAYALPTASYRHNKPPKLSVSFDGCSAGSQEIPPGRLSKIVFPIPDTCHIQAGNPTNVRILVDNLIDSSKTHDERSLSVLGKEIGFSAD